MLRSHYAIMAFIPCMLTGLLACTGEEQSTELVAVAEAEEAARVGNTEIYGTFRDPVSPGGVAVLTLMTNGAFHMEEAIVCVKYPCELPVIEGRYGYETQEGKSILVLRSDSGVVLGKYDYLLKADSLYLRIAGTASQFQELTRSDQPWCEAPRECALQGLPTAECKGVWTCESQTCSYRCGPRGEEPVTMPGTPVLGSACEGSECAQTPVDEISNP